MLSNLYEVFIAIGSNMGERIHNLQAAVEAIRRISHHPIKCSPVYETDPVGYVDQANFLNMVVQAYVTMSPRELLEYLLSVEAEMGRVREVYHGPRTMDLDILLYDSVYIANRDLDIPHPRMWERGFVMIPLSTLIPNHRGLGGITVNERAQRFREKGDVRYVGRFW